MTTRIPGTTMSASIGVSVPAPSDVLTWSFVPELLAQGCEACLGVALLPQQVLQAVACVLRLGACRAALVRPQGGVDRDVVEHLDGVQLHLTVAAVAAALVAVHAAPGMLTVRGLVGVHQPGFRLVGYLVEAVGEIAYVDTSERVVLHDPGW